MDQHLSEFIEQLRINFESNEGGDVEIHAADDLVLKVSKFILCLRSPVFDAMFKSETKEKQTNTVEIKNFESYLVKKFLLYLYTAKIDDLNVDAMYMFQIADYYDVKLLRETCLEHMLQKVNKFNVTEYFELAKKFELEDLKSKTIDFLYDNVDESTMHDYYEFAKQHSLEMVEFKVGSFIETNLSAVSITAEWQKFDFDFRLKILQEFFDQGPKLEIRDKSSTMERTSITVDNQKIRAYIKCYSLKNAGKKILHFKVNIVNNLDDTDEVKIYGCWPNNGKIEPNESLDVTIQFKAANFLILVNYEAAGKEIGEKQFEPNALVRQITLEPKKKYYAPVK